MYYFGGELWEERTQVFVKNNEAYYANMIVRV